MMLIPVEAFKTFSKIRIQVTEAINSSMGH